MMQRGVGGALPNYASDWQSVNNGFFFTTTRSAKGDSRKSASYMELGKAAVFGMATWLLAWSGAGGALTNYSTRVYEQNKR